MRSHSFVSVQDDSAEPRLYTFRECLLTGYAEDGAMVMPACVPTLDAAALRSLRYEDLVCRILQAFVAPTELDPAELHALLHRSYGRFCPLDAAQTDKQLRLSPFRLGGASYELLELTCGPTLTFKDIALQPLTALIGRLSDSPLHVLVGTSGDTGSAAIEAVLAQPRISISVLYPHDRIGRLQRLQMTTVQSGRVRVVAVDGSSDDLDRPIKAVLDDTPFSRRHGVVSINSINVGRLLLQIAHFCWAALRATEADTAPTEPVGPVSFCLPTGAMGQLIAALLAIRLGLPVRRVVVATNSNDCVSRLVNTGLYRPSAAVSVTSSNAMDISAPYNVERLVWLLAAGDQRSKAARVRSCMDDLRSTGQFELTAGERAELVRLGVVAAAISEEGVVAAMRAVWVESGVLVDPHTAVGVAAAAALASVDRVAGERVICVSTAHPAKFIDRVAAATGLTEAAVAQQLRRACPASDNVERAIRLHTTPAHDEYSVLWNSKRDWEAELRRLIEQSTAHRGADHDTKAAADE